MSHMWYPRWWSNAVPVISLQNYPQSFFLALMAIGLFVVRRQRARLGFPKPEYRSYSWVAIFFILANAFLLVMPWVPPKDGTYNNCLACAVLTNRPQRFRVPFLLRHVEYRWNGLVRNYSLDTSRLD